MHFTFKKSTRTQLQLNFNLDLVIIHQSSLRNSKMIIWKQTPGTKHHIKNTDYLLSALRGRRRNIRRSNEQQKLSCAIWFPKLSCILFTGNSARSVLKRFCFVKRLPYDNQNYEWSHKCHPNHKANQKNTVKDQILNFPHIFVEMMRKCKLKTRAFFHSYLCLWKFSEVKFCIHFHTAESAFRI